MKQNLLKVTIRKSLHAVFLFCITPPNSKYWIPGCVDERTNEFPIRKGTVYNMSFKDQSGMKIVVNDIEEDLFVEWISPDANYHCRYTFTSLKNNLTELQYREWVDNGNIADPFTPEILSGLKLVIEHLST